MEATARTATGLTPLRAIERLRVEAARRMLSETRLPVKRISQRCGFGSEEEHRLVEMLGGKDINKPEPAGKTS